MSSFIVCTTYSVGITAYRIFNASVGKSAFIRFLRAITAYDSIRNQCTVYFIRTVIRYGVYILEEAFIECICAYMSVWVCAARSLLIVTFLNASCTDNLILFVRYMFSRRASYGTYICIVVLRDATNSPCIWQQRYGMLLIPEEFKNVTSSKK